MHFKMDFFFYLFSFKLRFAGIFGLSTNVQAEIDI